jgi:hypothetical protein
MLPRIGRTKTLGAVRNVGDMESRVLRHRKLSDLPGEWPFLQIRTTSITGKYSCCLAIDSRFRLAQAPMVRMKVSALGFMGKAVGIQDCEWRRRETEIREQLQLGARPALSGRQHPRRSSTLPRDRARHHDCRSHTAL